VNSTKFSCLCICFGFSTFDIHFQQNPENVPSQLESLQRDFKTWRLGLLGFQKSQRGNVFLLSKKRCLLVQQEHMSSFLQEGNAFVFNKKTYLLVQHEDMYTLFPALLRLRPCLLVEQEDMYSSSTRRHVFVWSNRMCPLVGQGNMSSCRTARHVF